MEIVVNNINVPEDNNATIDEKRKKLMGFLTELGIEKDAIESRYYSEMLKELAESAPSV
jgi:adenylate cyclase class IV